MIAEKNIIQDAAATYAANGLCPIVVGADKRPIAKDWTNAQLLSPANTRDLFKTANYIGILCGSASGNLEVIDLDMKYADGRPLFSDFCQMMADNIPGLYESITIARTRSNGYHFYYRCPQPGGNAKLASRPTTEAERALNPHERQKVLFETRGQGGQVVAWPSTGYEFLQGGPGQIPTLTQGERDCLLAIARSFDEIPAPYETPRPKTTPTATAGQSPLDAFNEQADIPAFLEEHGWKIVETKGERVHLLRPGVTDSKTSANWHTGRRLLYVFTSSTEFTPDKAYNAAGVYMTVKNCDAATAYRELLAQGFGQPLKKNTPPAADEEDYTPRPGEKLASLYKAPRFPLEIFDRLPSPLREFCGPFNGIAKDLALITGMITGSGLFPQVSGIYFNKRCWPNLYGVVVGPSASGKGVLDFARDMGYATHTRWKNENAEAEQLWQAECDRLKAGAKNPVLPEKPRPRRLFVSANATAKGIQNQVSANGDGGVIMTETEIDAVANMMKTEHGDYGPFLRNAFEHENIGSTRAVAESVDIERPKVSLLLGGTPAQLFKLFPNAENGLFSRCILYAFKAQPRFSNPAADTTDYGAMFRELSHHFEAAAQSGEMEVQITFAQGERMEAKFNPLLQRYYALSGDDAASVVLRMGKIIFKSAMLFARLIDPYASGRVMLSEEAFTLAMDVADVFLRHSFDVFDAMYAKPSDKPAPVETPEQAENRKAAENINALYDALPQNFLTSEAYKIGAVHGKSESTTKRALKKYVEAGILEQARRGEFVKIQKN